MRCRYIDLDGNIILPLVAFTHDRDIYIDTLLVALSNATTQIMFLTHMQWFLQVHLNSSAKFEPLREKNHSLNSKT